MPTSYTETIIAWIPKELSGQSIKPLTTSSTSLAPKVKWIHNVKTALGLKVQLETKQNNFYS